MLKPGAVSLVGVLVFFSLAWNLPEFGGLEPYDQHRILQLFCLTLTSASLVISTEARRSAAQVLSATPPVALICVAVGLGCGLLSTLTARLPLWAITEWLLFCQLMLAGVAVAAARASCPADADDLLIKATLIGATIYAAINLIEFPLWLMMSSDVVSLQEFYPRFSNPRFPGQLFSLLIPLLIGLAAARPHLRKLSLGVASIFAAFAVMQGTRGTWLALVVAVVAVQLIRPAGYKEFLAACKPFFAFALAVYLACAVWLPSLLGKTVVSGIARAESFGALADDSGRAPIWLKAMDDVWQHPILGSGPMGFAAHGPGMTGHPHNSILQFVSEWGLPATACLMIPAVWFVFSLWNRPQRRDSAGATSILLCGLTAAVAAGLTQSMVDGVFVVPTTQMVLFAIAGWAGGIVAHKSYPDSTCRRPRVEVVVAVFAIATAAPLFGLAAHAIRSLDNLKAGYCGPMAPRFWVAGKLHNAEFPNPANKCGLSIPYKTDTTEHTVAF